MSNSFTIKYYSVTNIREMLVLNLQLICLAQCERFKNASSVNTAFLYRTETDYSLKYKGNYERSQRKT